MPKQHDYTLSEEELVQIQIAMKSHNAKVAKRASVIYSLHLAYHPTEVSRLHQVGLGTVYNHFNRFKAEGIAGLPNKDKSGRPPKADEAYRQRLREVLESEPQVFGLGFSVWTLPTLQAFMERDTGVGLSQNRISEVLKDEGYVYRRPKKDLGHKHDPELREQVKSALDEVKKVPKTQPCAYSIWTKSDAV